MALYGLIAFAAAYFVLVATPGPGMAAMVARGLGAGMRHAVPFALGFVVGDLTWFTVAATGIAVFHTVFAVLKYAGCAYLIYLAWKIWTSPAKASDIDATKTAGGPWSSFWASLSLTLGNPKPIVFFLSVMPLVVDVHQVTLTSYLAMASVLAVICFVSDMTTLYLANRARRIFRSETALKRINRGSAALMAGAAALIATRG